MKRATILLLLLGASFSFGRTVSDEEIAHALKVALEQRDHPHDRNSVQVSSVLITNKGICIEYRSPDESGAIHSGFAVYETDRRALFLDNSWKWEKTCLTGRYEQRREGKNVTQAVSAALKRQASAVSVADAAVAQGPVAQPVVPAPPTVAVRVPTAPAPVAAATRRPVVASSVPKSVATAAPVAPLVASTAPVTVSVSTPPTPVAVTATASVPVSPVAQPMTSATVAVREPASSASVVVIAATPVSAPAMTRAALAEAAVVAQAQVAAAVPAESAASPVVRVAAPVVVAPAEAGTIHGVTIIDNNGVLGQATPAITAPVAQESLADAARRVRKSKVQ